MNIDQYLVQGLRYFKSDTKSGTYYAKENTTRNSDTGILTGTSGVAVQILLQGYDQEQLGEVISDRDSLCLLHCKETLSLNEEDMIISGTEEYEVTKIYRNISKRIKIINVRKYK